MMLTDNVTIQQSDVKLTLYCKHSHMWFGWVLLIFTAFWIYDRSFGSNVNNGFGYWFGIILAVGVFVPIGLFAALPREIETTFDLRDCILNHKSTYLSGLYEKRHAIPFAQIEGVGLRECNIEGFSYLPFVKMRNGKQLSIATSNGGYEQYKYVIALVSTATGLHLLTLPAKR